MIDQWIGNKIIEVYIKNDHVKHGMGTVLEDLRDGQPNKTDTP